MLPSSWALAQRECYPFAHDAVTIDFHHFPSRSSINNVEERKSSIENIFCDINRYIFYFFIFLYKLNVDHDKESVKLVRSINMKKIMSSAFHSSL